MISSSDDERKATHVMLFAGISGGVVLILVLVFIVMAVQSLMATSRAPASGPYNVAVRQPPAAGRAADLFPDMIGPFKRETLSGNIDSFATSYTNGNNQVTIRGSRAVSVWAAQAGIQQLVQKNGPANAAQSIETSNYKYSYYLDVEQDGVRFAWSRDNWFFDIQTDSKATLDTFMESFKY